MRGRTLTRRGAYPQHSAGPMYAFAVQGLKYGWICLILWFELGTFISSVNECTWPDASLPLTDASAVHNQPQEHRRGRTQKVTHVLLIADAQIPDERSYPNLNRFLSKLAETFIDLNIRKSWRVTYRKTKPDVIIHLGDMMDGGRDERTAAEFVDFFMTMNCIFSNHCATF
jgi:ethanolamine phosphate phosphodiesterase